MADEKEDGPVVNDGQLSAEVSSRDSEVTGFLSRKDKTNALIASLQNPPTATKSVEIKVKRCLHRSIWMRSKYF